MSEQPNTSNPAGQPTLQRRVATHATALERMRASLAGPEHDLAVRSLARQSDADPSRSGSGDPSLAMLDAWAVVADVVAFYSERIATEGFLRTATQLGSVRELARMLGYELRPGVSGQTDLAFTVEDAPGAPTSVDVPQGTPVQSVPGDGELPQTFETGDDLQVRPGWNALPAVDARPQEFPFGQEHIWLRGRASVKAGDTVLVVGSERVAYGAWPTERARRAESLDDDERWEFRVVEAVTGDPDGFPGWTRLDLDHPIGYRRSRPLIAFQDVTVHLFTETARLFGANAPDPNLLADEKGAPPGAARTGRRSPATYQWDDFDVPDPKDPTVIEIDGAHPALLPGTWIVLEQPGVTEAYLVERVTPDGAAKFAVSGPLTRVRLDLADGLSSFSRRRATVHCSSTELSVGSEPDDSPVSGRTVRVAACDPPLPPGRRIMLSGIDADSGQAAVEAAIVETCTVDADGQSMDLLLTADLVGTYVRQGLHVLGNVVRATHGETVEQVLGSGDGRAAFASFTTRRAPLTHLRATTADGARPELTVRVDGVAWQQTPSLAEAGPHDRVFVLRYDDSGAARITLGDGVHGARPTTGSENIAARYRVGIGADGGLLAGQLSLLTRRPLGVRSVSNPAATQDWAPAETLEQARANAPLRVRTLDRAVSVADHEDFARGYAGVGPAKADLVWDGLAHRVVVSLLGAGAREPSSDLVDDLHTALDAARDPGGQLDVRIGDQVWFGVRVEVAHDPARDRHEVLLAVESALAAAFGADVRPFATPVTAAAVLVVIKAVPGVLACTMPRLLPLAAVPPAPQVATLPSDGAALDPVPAQSARWDDGVLPAELLALAPGAVAIEEMTK